MQTAPRERPTDKIPQKAPWTKAQNYKKKRCGETEDIFSSRTIV